MSRRRWTAVLAGPLLVTVLLLVTAPVAAQDPAAGEAEYAAACAGCHGADGGGVPGAFPPLADNPNSLDGDYVTDVIVNGLSGPIDVNGVSYDGTMPGFGHLGETAIADIVAFLATNFGAVADTTTTTADGTTPTTTGATTTTVATTLPPASGGDAGRGEALFLGSTRFENGGAACVACHTAGGRGNLGGQSMGPDLSGVVERYGGEAGVIGVLGAPAFPVMQELYVDKPMTDQERADLAAFFSRETTRGDTDGGDALLVIGLVGAVALFGAMVALRPFKGAGYSRRLRRNA